MKKNIYFHELTNERVIIETVFSFGICSVRNRLGEYFTAMIGDLKRIY
jgi:hypothetical protein